jgi:hypothetical protein
MLRRLIRAAGYRVAAGDAEDLAMLIGLRDQVADATQIAVNGLRSSGYTWRQLGDATGTSHVAAIQKWGLPRSQ